MARVSERPTWRANGRRPTLAVASRAPALAAAVLFGQRPDARASAASELWKPAPRTTWQWQITGRVDESVKAAMYDIDLFDARPGQINAGVVGRLHAKGVVVVCYV